MIIKINVFLSVLFLVSSCNNKDIPDLRQLENDNQKLKISLNNYKTQEQRVGTDWGQAKEVVVVMAVSGGGHRSANFAMGVLLELEEYVMKDGTPANLLNEIDYFSTVSGGGFAVGAYISEFYDHVYMRKLPIKDFRLNKEYAKGFIEENSKDYEDDNLRRNLERGYNNAILECSVKHPKTLFSRFDRGDCLQNKIDTVLLGSKHRNKSILLKDIFIPNDTEHEEVDPIFPYIFANATVYENKMLFTFTPEVLSNINLVGYDHLVENRTIGDQPRKEFAYGLPLSVAIKASASFPGYIPATTLTTDRKGDEDFFHLVDGGVSDNLGWQTAIELFRQQHNRETDGQEPERRKILIVVDAFNDVRGHYSASKGAPSIFNIAGNLVFDPGLLASHNNHLKTIEDIADRYDITTFFLGFSDAVKGESRVVAAAKKKLYSDCVSDRNISEADFFHELMSVNTSLNISPEIQCFLIAAGRLAVKNSQTDIDKLITEHLSNKAHSSN